MIKIKISIALIFLSLGSLTAQAFISKKLSAELSTNANAVAEVKILAVMVEFQKDKFDLTQGNGKFGTIYSKDYGNSIIDPLPHDVNYFSDHLRFAQNYFAKVSNNKLSIEYTVLPNIVTVSKVMRNYSPKEDEDYKPLADFSKEVWQLAVEQNQNVNFSDYNLFAIFHAGVGKDISTNQLLGEAKDLPSIYFSLETYKKYFGDSFTGFAAGNNGTITNTMILPETESREEKGIGESVLLELSINGLLVSSIASHLGLPDLFNSENGKSAIGRFGLMDGQSLFAYKGLFPPEPSAWEKIFLGWENPLVINSTQSNIKVFAKQVANNNESRIIKVPINSTEYYLIENRQRDANKDGIKITYKVAGVIKSLTLPKDTLSFNNVDVDTINGVVVDVDEFDWAVPGSGILIWHIDDKVINENLASNKINADKNRRGVDLEEADGIQDIGEEFNTIFGTTIIAEGDKFDFWYKGNPSEFYKNKFDATTKPNTKTNDGANSLISFSNFSDISNTMTFDLKIGNEKLKLLSSNKLNLTSKIMGIKHTNNNSDFWILSNSNLYRIDSSNAISSSNQNFADSNFVLIEENNKKYLFGVKGRYLNSLGIGAIDLGKYSNAPIVYKKNGNNVKLYIGLYDGTIAVYSFDTNTEDKPVLVETVDMKNPMISQVIFSGNNLYAISSKKISSRTKSVTLDKEIKKTILTKDSNGKDLIIALSKGNTFYVVKDFSVLYEFNIAADLIIDDFSLADIKQDGDNYILFYLGNKLNAVNLQGNMADNFPVEEKSISSFISYPLVADVNEDGYPDIISTSGDGLIFCYSGNKGELLQGFPLALGGTFSGTQTLVKREDDILLTSFTKDKTFFTWSLSSKGKVIWGNELGNNNNNAFVESSTGKEIITTFFPENRTYNWPNPVYDNQTYIRTFVSEDAKVTVRIFDLAGDMVKTLEFDAIGGMDNEIVWDVTNIQSGAYIAQVQVKSNYGKAASKIIKIAVVK